ncbi:non-ribosomal peptide synthetase [Streptomyces celluloflavus]|uniref:Non-ribosomal peptide synthetase n=1 Tax=Streptomyces celluloflavus TaxID=58344 RepID=A0ABW7RLN7_9ACTN
MSQPLPERNRTFRRPVSPIEWWFLGHPESMSPTLGVVVEGDGILAPERLAAAIATASEACPGARLVREEQTWVDGGTPPPLLIVDAAAGEDLLRLPQLQAPLAGSGVPYCQVILVRRDGGGRTAVAFRAHHAVMDAKGLLTWTADVFRALRGEQPLGAPDPVGDREVYDTLIDREVSDYPLSDKAPIMGACEPTSHTRTVTARRTLQGTHPGLAARLAVLLAEMVAEQVGDARPAAFYVPVNLRHYRPEVRSTANFSLGLTLRVTAGEEWETVHERLLRAIQEREQLRTVPSSELLSAPLSGVEAMLLEINRRVRAKESFPTDAVLSHTGRVELAELHAPGFTAHTAFPLVRPTPGGAPDLNILEVGRHTEITLSWWDGDATGARIEALLDRIAAGLAPHRVSRPASPPAAPAAASSAGTSTDGKPAASPADRTTDGAPAGLVTRFLRRAAEHPDALALDGGPGERLTYRQFERRTAVVAAALSERGVGPETVVGVLGERSVPSVVAIWGVLRAGGAYLPIDARNPDPRIADLLADSGAPLCLLPRMYEERACIPEGCTALSLDDLDWSGDPQVPDPEPCEDQLAYVIYTSGSTGRPKGVEVEHGALRVFTDWTLRDLGIDAGTRMPLLTSIGFDLAANAFYLPLLAGGTTILRPAEVSHAMLRELLLESGANTLTLTPSHLVLINRLGLRPAGFRSVVVIGEQLHTSVAREAREVFGPDCRIVNTYGPTEATVMMTRHTFDPAADTGPVVPIGVPTDGTEIILLDEHGRFTADGEAGELCIGGAQLARGYRGSPELTADRFVRLADGTPVYRTGDLVRPLPGGSYEFQTRLDDQVKILGHRVEPAEVAQALRAHPFVADAVVLPRTTGDRKALAAYVVRAPGADHATAEALTAHLAKSLPAYLVPAATVFVDAIPQNMNGKTDPSRLPDPFARDHSGEQGAPAHAPADDLAAAVAEIWSEILGLAPDHLSDDADFHRLGGNSLEFLTMLATVADRVVGEPARPHFDAALPHLIRNPTLRHTTAASREAREARPDHVIA